MNTVPNTVRFHSGWLLVLSMGDKRIPVERAALEDRRGVERRQVVMLDAGSEAILGVERGECSGRRLPLERRQIDRRDVAYRGGNLHRRHRAQVRHDLGEVIVGGQRKELHLLWRIGLVVLGAGHAEHARRIGGDAIVCAQAMLLRCRLQTFCVGAPLVHGQRTVADPVQMKAAARRDDSIWPWDVGREHELLEHLERFASVSVALRGRLHIHVQPDRLERERISSGAGSGRLAATGLADLRL